jgi:hypothetical protein
MNWYLSLPPAEVMVPCGTGTHPVRWEAGRLDLPAHPDAEAELVLSALGGEKARCVEVAETWARHAEDLDVLMTGPRSRADQVTVGWDDAEEHRATWFGLPKGMVPGRMTTRGSGGSSPPGQPRPSGPGGSLRRLAPQLPEDLIRRVQARTEVLRLLALGPAFQFRLAGTVTAAWAADARAADRASRQPELTATLTGRAAPAIADWLAISPDAITVAPSQPLAAPHWGSLEVIGSGASRLVRASLPVDWLASVWACGLAVVDGHLVVAVEEPGWPRARVLALPEPGAAPVSLDVTGTDATPVPTWTQAT